MKVPFYQDSVGGMCGVFSILNGYRLVKNAKFDEVEILYREIIDYLSRKRMLKDILLDGMLHKDMTMLINEVVGDRFVEKISNGKWSEYSLSAWWKYSKSYLEQNNTAIILAIGGKYWHYSTVERMSDKVMFLQDSDGLRTIRRTSCRFPNYKYEDRIIVYPSQCWLIKG
jgi:hypothetical protein